MATSFQITFDAHDPMAQAEFWSAALGYRVQPPPKGFDSWDAFAESIGMPEAERDKIAAAVDPDKEQPRLLFLRVPEDKSVKNRVHLDVNATTPDMAEDERKAVLTTEIERLEALGAHKWEERTEYGHSWIVMYDPEGNEFCIQ